MAKVYPGRFEFSLRGYPREMDVMWKDGKLLFKCCDSTREIIPSEVDWLTFWSDIESTGVWHWRREYRPDGLCLDGTMWSLTLSHGWWRRVTSEGSNSYPGTEGLEYPKGGPFDQFVRAVERLCRERTLD